ncbi:hypothetical protein [Rubritalea sp.]|uniref:hypothetical protein n=1 Tax=Rubritalea sp. TaxID=2109375 RepID=UPI003EF2B322
MKLTRAFISTLAACLVISLTSCMEQKVTDSAGNVIYDKTVSGTPWQSIETTRSQVEANEEALGYQ